MSKINTQTMAAEKKQEGQMGRWARYYDLLMFFMTLGREKALRKATLDLAQVKTGDKVLEIGCGTGTLSLAAKKRVGPSGEVAGIDIAPEMAAVASKKAARKGLDVSFQVGSVAYIPFPDLRFDVALCSFMIFHMPEDVRRKGLAEIYRVLKSGGHLFILDFAMPDKEGQRKSHIRELSAVLKEYSFSEIELERVNFMAWYFSRTAGGLWFLRGKTA
jgi:ubiquinone/menaquinone biosynthesis C-methylase UbiE